jgi:serine/threonine-protein kinase
LASAATSDSFTVHTLTPRFAVPSIEDQLRTALGDRYTLGPVLGEGGMATVYRAEDSRNHRAVALKVLKQELGAVLGPERFLAEIQVTANLQHPHLLPLFDSGEVDGLLYYVMPLVEGESLRARLDRERQLPVAEAVRITIAIAGALDYAHRHGVVHRDLKPENILLHDGQPLVADFGIALAISRAGGERITQTGLSLGTPQYMSPEQAAADRVIDGRSDIYALGAVLYEMLTGDPPHTGSTMQAVIARVLTETPRSVRDTRASIPAYVATAIERSLAKMPADRFDSAQQFAQALTATNVDVVSGSPAPPAGARSASSRRRPALLAVGAVAFVAVTSVGMSLWWRSRSVVDASVVRLVVKALPDALEPASITPDGRNLVYVGLSQGKRMVFVRPIDDFRAEPIAGTEDALHPFVSPDGQWIGYFATDDKMRKVAIRNGAPTVIASVFRFGRASWGGRGDGTIVTDFNKLGVLSWVRPSDAVVGRLTAIDSSRDESGHFQPMLLPDGTSVVFAVTHANTGTELRNAELAFVSLADAQTAPAPHVNLGVKGRRVVAYVDGWLLYEALDGMSLLAVRLDLPQRRVVGAPVAVLQDPGGIGSAHLAQSGTLVYSHRSSSANEALLVDTAGNARPLFDAMPNGPYMNPRLSPDGRRLVIQGTSPQGSDLWVHDLATRTSTRVTSTGGALSPSWSPDGTRLFFVSNLTGSSEMLSQPVDGSAPAEPLFRLPQIVVSQALTPDARTLIYSRQIENVWSIWAASMVGDRTPRPVILETFDNYMPMLSPDGRWLAYASMSSGAQEIHVRPYPGPGGAVQVSESGGTEPVWSRDGTQLFYRNGDEMLAATITSTPSLAVTAHKALFRHPYEGGMPHANFASTSDGGFIMIGAPAGDEPDMVIVVNWLSELRTRLAARR